MKSGFIVKPFTKEYTTDVINLLSVGFGKYMSKEYLDLFNHIQFSNPVQQCQPLGVVATLKDKVVGYRGFVGSLWKFNEIPIKTLTPTGSVVHPSYRNQGLFVEMNNLPFDLYQNSYDYFLNTSSNKYSTPIYLKLNWQVLGEKDNLFKRVLLKKISKKCPMQFSESVPIETIKSVNSNSHFRKNMIKLDFDSETYIKWLYTSNKYYFCTYAEGNYALAYVCFKLHRNRCEIIDYDSATTSSTLNRMIHAIAAKYKCLNFTAYTVKNNSLLYKSFLDSGFFSTNYKPFRRLLKKEMMPILIRPIHKNYDEKKFAEKSNFVNNIDNWMILRICNH